MGERRSLGVELPLEVLSKSHEAVYHEAIESPEIVHLC